MAADQQQEPPIEQRGNTASWAEAAQRLRELPAHRAAAELTRMSGSSRAMVYRFLPKDTAYLVFEALDAPTQQQLVAALASDEARSLIEQLAPDDRVRLLEELPAGVVQRVLAELSPDEQRQTAELLGYQPGTIGRRMSPAVLSLHADATVDEALERVRRDGAGVETLDILPVTDGGRMLHGVVRLSSLVIADPERRVGDLSDDGWPSMSAYQDEESAARLMQEADLVASPVVDAEGRLVGIVTVDDAMEILEAADTEDYVRSGGSEPLRRPYLAASIMHIARRRASWLLLLIVASALTVQVLEVFEATLEQVVTLALFIPLLIGTGGNAGAQAATTVIRAMAVGEVAARDTARVVLRELATGTLLGLALGLGAFLPVAVLFDVDLALIVAGTLLVICAWASTVGSMMPLLAQRLGVDPSLVSAPVVTTLVDATGLIAYFSIARIVLGDQLA